MRCLRIVMFKSFSDPHYCSKSSPFCKLGLNFMFLALHCSELHFLSMPGPQPQPHCNLPYHVSSCGLQISSGFCIYFTSLIQMLKDIRISTTVRKIPLQTFIFSYDSMWAIHHWHLFKKSLPRLFSHCSFIVHIQY